MLQHHLVHGVLCLFVNTNARTNAYNLSPNRKLYAGVVGFVFVGLAFGFGNP